MLGIQQAPPILSTFVDIDILQTFLLLLQAIKTWRHACRENKFVCLLSFEPGTCDDINGDLSNSIIH